MSARPRKVAVLVNANARAVTDSVIRLVTQVVPPEHLYVSRSLAQSRTIARQIADSAYDSVLTGGGDGTLVQFITEASGYLASRPEGGQLPSVGVLKLGTGNSLAALLGASEPTEEGLTADYWKARYTAGFRETRFLDVEGRIAPFSGVGLDARILNDYIAVKDRSRGTAFEKYLSGGIGYAVAIGGLTIPKVGGRSLPIVTVVNEGAPAWRVGPDGRRVGPLILKGEVIHRGPAQIASCSKLDGFGYHFRLFPFAYVRDDRLHLRVCSAGVIEILSKLHLIWKGEYFSETIHDFMVERIRMQSETPLPFQIGGDGEGYRSSVQIGLSHVVLRLVDFQTAPEGLPVGPNAKRTSLHGVPPVPNGPSLAAKPAADR